MVHKGEGLKGYFADAWVAEHTVSQRVSVPVCVSVWCVCVVRLCGACNLTLSLILSERKESFRN